MKNLFLLGALLIPTMVYSANDLEKWNSEVGRTVRQAQSDKLAQTTYKEISSKNVKVAQDMRTVYPQIETSAQVAGSKTRVVAEAVLAVDKDKVWKDWAKKIGKVGKGANAVGGALVIGGLILDAVDWVIDEGGKVNKKPDPSYNSQFLYAISDVVYPTKELTCKTYTDRYPQPNRNNIPSGFVSGDFCRQWNDAQNRYNDYNLVQIKNPNYNPSAPPQPPVPVSEAEIEQALKNILNDPKYADLASQMIGNTYSMGSDNPEPDPAVVNDIKNAQKDVLKSDNPKGDGKTRTDPKIDTGTDIKSDSTTNTESTTNVNETTTTNPDGSTTTTGTNVTNNTTITNNTTEIPPLCEYAAKLCDWMDWTQDDEETEKPEDEDPEEFDIGTIDKNRFRANGQCPAPIQVNESVRALGKSVDFDLTIEWTQICNVAEDSSPLVLLISTITGLLILVGGGRNGEP